MSCGIDCLVLAQVVLRGFIKDFENPVPGRPGALKHLVQSMQPADRLIPGASTSLAISFRPAALGVRTATVRIASNDADENPYELVIRGTGDTAARRRAVRK